MRRGPRTSRKTEDPLPQRSVAPTPSTSLAQPQPPPRSPSPSPTRSHSHSPSRSRSRSRSQLQSQSRSRSQSQLQSRSRSPGSSNALSPGSQSVEEPVRHVILVPRTSSGFLPDKATHNPHSPNRNCHWITCKWPVGDFERLQRLAPNHVFKSNRQSELPQGYVRVEVWEWVSPWVPCVVFPSC